MQRHSTDDITRNLSFLAHHLSNLKSILLELIEKSVISQDESDEIESKVTPLRQNSRLLEIIQRKDWPAVKELFLEILRKTNNGHCANVIDDIPNDSRQETRIPLHSELLRSIWWPEKKLLIEYLHERKIGDKLLVHELHDRLMKDRNRMVVITESPRASKLTGMGGVGKTLTSTWYAHKYEHEYDHVLWIDCGEGSLLTSFQKLARDLEIKNRNELLDIEDFARKSYEELMQFKCLWIFDHAENYKGADGIQKVLPKYKEKFFCLITSRSSEWEVRNIGFGKICDLQLDIFSEQESMQFFKQNLEKEIKYTEFQLKELCRLSGNLPLAMQLAVAALNDGKVDFKDYITTTPSDDAENIVVAEFDDHEKIINANVKITLDSIFSKEENGNVAKDILNIFGYIRPDDVILDFFEDVLQLSFEDVYNGIKLLVKYSLISKELKTINKETKLCVSIHRLLQEVIRFNGRDKETETIRAIFNCTGFADYKLLPFTKYADAELRKEFPRVKTELLDQQQLMRLVKERRIDESVELAKFIDQELQKGATKFNYAICLEMNGQLEDGIKVLEALCKQDLKVETNHQDSIEMGLLKLEKEVSQSLVGGHLLISHWKMDNKEKMQEMLQQRKSFQMNRSQEMMTSLLRILNSNLILSNYSLTNEGSMCKLVLGGVVNGMQLLSYSVDVSLPLPNLQELEFVDFTTSEDKNGKDFNMIDVSDWLPKKLHKLKIISHQIMLPLGCISSIEDITLQNCSLSLDSVNRISPTVLVLNCVSYFKNGQELSNVNVNEFIDFQNLKKFQLLCGCTKKNVSIDLSEESANMYYLYLTGVTMLSLKSANGRVNIKEINVKDCLLDLSILPSSHERLELSDTEVFASGAIDLPNLKYLRLIDISQLPHFRSLQVTHLHLDLVIDLNMDLLPPSIKIVRINKSRSETRLIGGVRNLEKIILHTFPLNEVDQVMSNLHLHPKHLVLYSGNYNSYKPQDLIQLMQMKTPIIAIGTVDWQEKDFNNSIISKQVDGKSSYYAFHEGIGKSIEGKEFREMFLLQLSFNN